MNYSFSKEDQDSRRNGFISTADEGDVPTPTIGEVKDAIKQLKNNKVAGKDGIGVELIKMGPGQVGHLSALIDSQDLEYRTATGGVEGGNNDCATFPRMSFPRISVPRMPFPRMTQFPEK